MRLVVTIAVASIAVLALGDATAGAAIPISVASGGGSTDFTVSGSYGCDDSGSNCDSLDIEVHDDTGRVVWHEVGTTDEASDIFGDGTFTYGWTCNHPGVYDWQASEGGTVTDSASGIFRVPRCKPDIWRFVSYGTAARAAISLIPGDEVLDFVKCFKGKQIRGGRAGEWGCAVTSNNSWRVCDRFFAVDFYRHASDGGWGPYANKASYYHFAKTRCWAL